MDVDQSGSGEEKNHIQSCSEKEDGMIKVIYYFRLF